MTVTLGGLAAPRKRSETLKRLLAAAEDILAEEGLGAVSIGSVCSRAGFTRGAFYSNFTDLDELFLALLQRQHDRVIENIDEVIATMPSAGAPIDTVELIMSALPLEPHRIFVLDRVVTMALADPAVAAKYQEILAAMLGRLGLLVAAGLAAHDREASIAPERLAGALMALVSGELRLSIGLERGTFLSAVRESATALLLQLSRVRGQ